MSSDSDDLKPGVFPQDLSWAEDDVIESLENLYSFVNVECQRAIDWYFTKKRNKKIGGYVFRVGAILALAGAGVIPVLGEIYKNGNVPCLSPAWATIALAIVPLFVALDRLGGYTSGWVRYVRSGQALTELQSDFKLEWEKQRLLLHSGQSDETTVQEGIDKCRTFLEKVYSIIRVETDQWAKEFQKFLLEFEKKAKE